MSYGWAGNRVGATEAERLEHADIYLDVRLAGTPTAATTEARQTASAVAGPDLPGPAAEPEGGLLDAEDALPPADGPPPPAVPPAAPACQSQCDPGARQCLDSLTYRQCQDTNGDGCDEWTGPWTCTTWPGSHCSNGWCVF